jgi:hypothetical protein
VGDELGTVVAAVPAVETLVASAAQAVGCAKSVAAGTRCIHELPVTAQGLAKGHLGVSVDPSTEANDVQGTGSKGALERDPAE